jgi:uncharacterized protein
MLLLAIVAVLALLFAAAWWGQERIAYQPPRDPDPIPAGTARLDYRAADGQSLFALVASPARTSAPTHVLVAFHGNADLAVWMLPWAKEVARRTGVTVVLPEYRGYGGLPGRPSPGGLRLDARAVAAAVRARFGAAARFDLYGHSLGSAVATELADETPPAVLVLESPFTSARDIARIFATPVLSALWPIVGRIPYDTERRVRTLDVPVWVAHGDRDIVVPVRMGRAVFAAAKRPRELLIVPGGTHNDLAQMGDSAYWNWLGRALR